MDKQIPYISWFRSAVLAIGAVSGALGLVTIAGSYTNNVSLLKVLPAFVPMEFNAALGFILCGLGLMSVGFGSRYVALLSGIAAAIGLLVIYFGTGQPTAELLASAQSPLTQGTLVVGLLMALLLALMAHFANSAALQTQQAKLSNQELEKQIIQRKQAEEEVQRNLRRLVALRDIYLAITSTFDLDTLLDLLLRKIDLHLPNSVTTVRLISKENGELEPIVCQNLSDEEWRAEEGELGCGVPKAVFGTRAPLLIGNVQTDPRVENGDFFRKHGLLSYLGVPLVAKDQDLGVLSFYTREEHLFSREEVDFYSMLAAQVAIAIYNSQIYEESVAMAQDLGRANKVKSEFLSVMSHELRTPLHIIMTYTSMIQDGLLGELNQKQEKALGNIEAQSQDLLTMISGILDTTKLGEDGEIKVQNEEVPLVDFLDGLKSGYAVPLEKAITMTWDYPSDLPVIHIDRGKLKDSLLNLVNNAVKFTEKGSVTVSARYFSDQQAVRFQVVDTGIGIPKDKLPVVFEMFRQLDSSESRPYEGVGLGLYIVKKYTEALGGTITVESEPGKGSIFTITLPFQSSRCHSVPMEQATELQNDR